MLVKKTFFITFSNIGDAILTLRSWIHYLKIYREQRLGYGDSGAEPLFEVTRGSKRLLFMISTQGLPANWNYFFGLSGKASIWW